MCEKIFRSAKEKPYTSGISVVAFLVCMPSIIWICYFIGDCGYILIHTSLTVDGALCFLGSLLAFLGTVALGALALWQNKEANNINQKLSQIEENNFKLSLRPFVMISNWTMYKKDATEILISPKKIFFDITSSELNIKEYFCLSLYFINTTNQFVTVKYSDATVYQDRDYSESKDIVCNWPIRSANQQNPKLYLNSNSVGEIVFYATFDDFEKLVSNKITLELILQNRLGDYYKENIDIIILSCNKYDNNDCFIGLSAQNYRLGKFTENKNIQWE